MSRTPQSVFDAIAAQRRHIRELDDAARDAAALAGHDDDIGAEIAEREAIDEVRKGYVRRGRW